MALHEKFSSEKLYHSFLQLDACIHELEDNLKETITITKQLSIKMNILEVMNWINLYLSRLYHFIDIINNELNSLDILLEYPVLRKIP